MPDFISRGMRLHSYAAEKDEKHQKLFKKYRQAYPKQKGGAATQELINIWKNTLDRGKDEKENKEGMIYIHSNRHCDLARTV